MKIKTSELTGPALDWAVAKTQGDTPVFRPHQNSKGATVYRNEGLRQSGIPFRPSLEWAQGGPIIEREQISLTQFKGHPSRAHLGTVVQYEHAMFAPEGQPLIAAMRCFVASRLGDEVDVPEELA